MINHKNRKHAADKPMPSTWILVADAGRARLFSVNHDEEWSLVNEREHVETRLTGNELRAIEPGREQSPAAGHQLAIEKMPLPQMEKERFARELALMLAEGLNRHDYADLVLVAPPEFLGRLQHTLDAQVLKRVSGKVPKDYTNSPLRELQQRLAEADGFKARK